MLDSLIKAFKAELDDNVSNTLNDNIKKINEVFLNIEIVEEIVINVVSEPQIILKEIVHDLISSLYSAMQALYRNAYISLRSGIELSLAYIYFLDHNYDYLFWKLDKYDMKWAVLQSEENGVLSQNYLSVFVEDNFELLFESCHKIYRDCSQFVHGKYEYMHTVKYQSVKYDKNTCEKYLNMLLELTNIIVALLLIRHGKTLLNINETYKSEIENNLNKLQLYNTLKMIKECWK